MFEQRELRIGNLIEYKLNSGSHFVEVNTYLLTVIDVGKKPFIDRYKPIPLTEEWLLKFGFEEIVFDSEETGYGVEYEISISHGSKMVVYDDMSFGIENNELDTHWLSLDFDKFSGVHQLQNLYFALTGEELEINL